MGWTGIARSEHSREGLRYPSDMTGREWLLTAPFIPPAKTGGRRRTTDMREVVNALLYIASSGGAWRMLPKCFPPVSTVRRYFYAWRNTGLFETIKPRMLVAIALANKMARMAWAMLTKQEDYRTPATATAA